jgi:hypothetical protein
MKIETTRPWICRHCQYLEKNPGYKGYTSLLNKRPLSRARMICTDVKSAERLYYLFDVLGYIK